MSKHILITGATDGIGKLTAQSLAKQQQTLILHGRNAEKLNSVISHLQNETHNKQIFGIVADFAHLDAVRQMVETLKKEYNKIDVLINNAGVFKVKNPKNSAGLDRRFVVNYVAPYILTQGLVSLLEQAPNPQVLNLSSAAQSPIDWEALAGKHSLDAHLAYAQSKLALTMWSFYFAKKHPHITTIAVNPGSLLNTKMAQEAYGKHWSEVNKGADILCDLSLHSHDQKESRGSYFDNDKGCFSQAHRDAYDKEKIQKLMRETEKLIHL